MMIPFVESVKIIEQQYRTGEEPVLVMCSDKKNYVCKYMRTSTVSYKLSCELIGSVMAMSWGLPTPQVAFVNIKQPHWSGKNLRHSLSAPAFGSQFLEKVGDVTPSTYGEITPSAVVLRQLMQIALFDFWIANEDRNANNANLIYDVDLGQLVAIDFGCILNTATFDYPLSQLTSTDTILCSDLFRHILNGFGREQADGIVKDLQKNYHKWLNNSSRQISYIQESMPNQWHVPSDLVGEKLTQLFDSDWTIGVWDNFMECLKENM